jgi:hypothetical protein
MSKLDSRPLRCRERRALFVLVILLWALVAWLCATTIASTAPRLSLDGAHSPAPSLLATVSRVTPVASYGGWVAWSRYEPAMRAYQLMVRSPAGTVTQMGAPQPLRPFEVSLGILASGGVGAVYPRCAEPIEHRECILEQLAIEAAHPREVRLSVPGAGSFFLPALWKRTVAFLRSRTVARRRFPTELIEWTIGTNHLSKLQLPNNSYYAAEIKEQPEVRDTENAQGRITALALNGTQVAYVRVAPWGEWARSDLWVQKPAQHAKAIDWIGTGGGAAYGTRTYLSPTISGSWLYAYRQYHELGHAWVRYSLNTGRTQRAGIDLGDDSNGLVQAAAPLDRGVVWSLQNQTEEGLPNAGARVLSLAEVRWTTLKYQPSLASWAAAQEPRRE